MATVIPEIDLFSQALRSATRDVEAFQKNPRPTACGERTGGADCRAGGRQSSARRLSSPGGGGAGKGNGAGCKFGERY
jgi:hypothetical protein